MTDKPKLLIRACILLERLWLNLYMLAGCCISGEAGALTKSTYA